MLLLLPRIKLVFFFFLFLFFKRKKYLRKCTVRIWAISRERSTLWHHDQISSSFGGLGKTANRTHPIILRAHIQLPNKAMGSASSTQGRECSRPQPRPYILWNHDRHHHSPCNAFVFLTEDPVMMGWPRYSLIAIEVLKVGFTKKDQAFVTHLHMVGLVLGPWTTSCTLCLHYQLYRCQPILAAEQVNPAQTSLGSIGQRFPGLLVFAFFLKNFLHCEKKNVLSWL